MIKRLILEKFGRFKNASFDFSGVTVFLGANESGKTTIFDALLDNLCDVAGNTEHGKKLKSRYGEKGGKKPERKSSIEFDEQELSFQADEFLNLYAVKSGLVNTSIDADSDWVKKIKGALFTGGIDPGSIQAELERQCSNKGSLAHMIKLKDAQDKKRIKQTDLKSKLDERKKILESEASQEKESGQLDLLVREIKQKEEDLDSLKTRLEEQQKVLERERLLDVLKKIDRLSSLKKDLDSLSDYKDNRFDEISALETAKAESNNAQTRLEAEIKIHAGNLRNMQTDADDLQHDLDLSSRLIVPLKNLLEQMEKERPATMITKRARWKKPFLALAGVLLSAGIATFVLLQFSLYGIIALAAGFTSATVMLYLAYSSVQEESTPDLGDFMKRMVRKWRDISGDESFSVDSPAELSEKLIHIEAKYRQDGEKLREKSTSISSLQKDITEKKDKLSEESARISVADDKICEWLKKYGVNSKEAYLKKCGDYSQKFNELNEVEADLKQSLAEYQSKDFEDLKVRCENRHVALAKETVSVKKIDNEQIAGLNNQITRLEVEIKQARVNAARLNSKVQKEKGRIEGSLGNLPETIRGLELEIAGLSDEIASMELRRKAAGVAAKIFGEIACDSSLQFKILSEDIAERFTGFMPGADLVKMGSFSEADFEVKDAGGEYRSPELLSTGTKDAFWLAARLSLARKANPDGLGIVVLDEPFHSFDAKRVNEAMLLLKKFRDDTGWQVTLFTKDRHMCDDIKQAFIDDNIKVHEL